MLKTAVMDIATLYNISRIGNLRIKYRYLSDFYINLVMIL